MTSLIHSISEVFSAFFRLIYGILEGIFVAIEDVFGVTFHLVRGFLGAVYSIFDGIVEGIASILGGVAKALVQNILLLTIIAVVYIFITSFARSNQSVRKTVKNKKTA